MGLMGQVKPLKGSFHYCWSGMTGTICAQVPQRELRGCLLGQEVAGWGGIMCGKAILNSLLVLNVVLPEDSPRRSQVAL